MPQNVEIKLRVADLRPLVERLHRLPGVRDAGRFEQLDVFFHSRTGRLKLRLTPGKVPQLIHYDRADAASLRSSRYTIVETADAEALRVVLDRVLGTLGEVRKRRHLFLHENVRIHLDEVEALGSFVELEAVVDAEHDDPACHASAQRLLQALDLADTPAESHAYIDLLQSAQH